MPTVARTSRAALLDAARRLLEQGGAEAVTMHAIARAEGIRAPSLYKHFPDRAAVMEQLALEGFAQLADRMTAAAGEPAPIFAMAHAYRDYARESPERYLQMLSAAASRRPSVDAARRQVAMPILDQLRPLVGALRALSVARLLTAFLHGFVTMELAGAFRLGGDVEADFDAGVRMLHDLLARIDHPDLP